MVYVLDSAHRLDQAATMAFAASPRPATQANQPETPTELTGRLRNWLCSNQIPIATFAKEILKRSQGTVSSLWAHPPTTFPVGAGKEVWDRMKAFMESEYEKKELAGTIFFFFKLSKY